MVLGKGGSLYAGQSTPRSRILHRSDARLETRSTAPQPYLRRLNAFAGSPLGCAKLWRLLRSAVGSVRVPTAVRTVSIGQATPFLPVLTPDKSGASRPQHAGQMAVARRASVSV
jgi:hypothetical protein